MRWVVVGGAQQDPGDRPRALLAPLAEERGLAEPRRRTDQQQLVLHATIELATQARPGNQAGPGRRDVQFRVDVRERER
jgi:hypothetical protein